MTFHFPGFIGFFGDHFYRLLKIELTFNLFLLMKILSTHYLDFTFPRSSDTPSAVVGSPVGEKNQRQPPTKQTFNAKITNPQYSNCQKTKNTLKDRNERF